MTLLIPNAAQARRSLEVAVVSERRPFRGPNLQSLRLVSRSRASPLAVQPTRDLRGRRFLPLSSLDLLHPSRGPQDSGAVTPPSPYLPQLSQGPQDSGAVTPSSPYVQLSSLDLLPWSSLDLLQWWSLHLLLLSLNHRGRGLVPVDLLLLPLSRRGLWLESVPSPPPPGLSGPDQLHLSRDHRGPQPLSKSRLNPSTLPLSQDLRGPEPASK